MGLLGEIGLGFPIGKLVKLIPVTKLWMTHEKSHREG